ncbi:MAG: hypothetical protein RLT05_20005, partial [Bauldia litoralis]
MGKRHEGSSRAAVRTGTTGGRASARDARYRGRRRSLLAPFGYSSLIWATFFGFIVFGDLPDELTIAGAAIVIAAGLYIWHRERTLGRQS